VNAKAIFGALLVSVALCSQWFGFGPPDRMLGLNSGGCGECKACDNVACCENTCGCETCKCRYTPVRDLFADLEDLFEAKGCCGRICGAVATGCCPEPVCCETACGSCEKFCKVRNHEACCEKPTCCEKDCQPKCHKLYRRPVIELLDGLFCCDICGNGCGCEANYCQPNCHKLYRRPVIELLDSVFHDDEYCEGCAEGCSGQCENGQASGGGLTPAPAPTPAPANKATRLIPAAPDPVPTPPSAE
jgi:hypothetical protein